jgi:hypothetical protein
VGENFDLADPDLWRSRGPSLSGAAGWPIATFLQTDPRNTRQIRASKARIFLSLVTTTDQFEKTRLKSKQTPFPYGEKPAQITGE